MLIKNTVTVKPAAIPRADRRPEYFPRGFLLRAILWRFGEAEDVSVESVSGS